MKKLITVLLLLSLLLTLSACGSGTSATDPFNEKDFSFYDADGKAVASPNEIMTSVSLSEHEDAQTHRGIKIGSSADELLNAYEFTAGKTAYVDGNFEENIYDRYVDLSGVFREADALGGAVALVIIIDENGTEVDALEILQDDAVDINGYRSLMFIVKDYAVLEVNISLYL